MKEKIYVLNAHTKKKIRFIYTQKKKLRGLSPDFNIYVSVSHSYISIMGPPIFLQQNRQNDGGNI
jgi:hypothetical protein